VRTALKVADRRDLTGGPRLAEACFFVGEERFDEGRYEDAARLYAQAARRGEGELVAQARYKEGFAHLRRDDLEAAARSFELLVNEHAGSTLRAEGMYLLGEVHHRAGRHEEAVAVLSTFREEQPKHEAMPKALFRLGISLAELERWREAEQVLAELARKAPDFAGAAEADLWRGRALAELGDPRGARAAFERAIGRTDGVIAARARIGLGRLALTAGDAEAALSEFLKVTVLYANEEEVGEALFLAGRSLEELGDEERAREQYRELLTDYAATTYASSARERLRALGNE
jgi:TolA-binding protein